MMKTYGRKASSGERASQKFAEINFASLSNSRENQLPVVQNQTVQYVPTEIVLKPSLMDMAQGGRKKRQTSSESKHKKRNCSFDQTDNAKREALRSKIRIGQQSHISHLQERMDEFNEKGQAGFGFRVASPMLWKRGGDTNDQNQWLEWMLTLGFDGPTSDICPNVCCYPEAKIDDLVKALRGIDLSSASLTTHPDFIVRERARSESFASMNSASTSSNKLVEMDQQGRRSVPPSLLQIHVDSDDSSMYSPWSQCNTGGSNNTFSRPNSSRSYVNPSPLESAFMTNIKDMSLTSPRGSFTTGTRLENSPLIKPRVQRMNRISEVDDAVSNDSTPFKLPSDDTAAMAMDTSFTTALPSTMEEDEVEMIASNENHHLDPLSEVSTVRDEDSILEDLDQDEEVAATQLAQLDGTHPSSPHSKTTMMNMMMVDDSTSHFFSPQPARQSSSAGGDCMGSILPPRFLTSSMAGNHHNQLSKPHEVRFSNAILTSPEARDVFAPISKKAEGASMIGILGGGNGAFHPTTDHEPVVRNVSHRRQLQRRSNTLPAPHAAAAAAAAANSHHHHRGDVTPGGISLSQNAVENYVTPQGKLIGEIDPFMRSTPTHPTIIDALTRKFLEELHKLDRIHDVNIALRDLRFDCSGYQLILGGPLQSHHLHHQMHSHSYNAGNMLLPDAVVLQRATSVPLALEGSVASHALNARLSYPAREYGSNHDFSLLRNSTGSLLDTSSGSPFALMLHQNHNINHHRGSAGGGGVGHAIYRQSSDSTNSGGISLLISSSNNHNRESSLLSTPPHHLHHDGRDSSILASHQAMMFTKGSTTSSNEVSQRKKLKKRQTKAKYRRLSLQVNTTSNLLFENSDTSLNMSVDNSLSLNNSGHVHHSHHSHGHGNHHNDRRKSLAFCSVPIATMDTQQESTSNKTLLGDIMEDEEFPLDEDRVSDNRKIDGLEAENMMKRAIIIGGAFHGRYDNSCPVVSAPSTSEKRVDDLRFTGVNDLSIRLYVPGDQNSTSQGGRWVDLGADWCWLSCSPVGYLVGRARSQGNNTHSKSVLYYLPKHPAQWNAFFVPEQSLGDGAMEEEEGYNIEAVHEDMIMIQDDFDFHNDVANHNQSHANKAMPQAATTSKMVQLPSKAMHEILAYLPLHDQFQACLTLSKPWAIATIKSLASNISEKMWDQRGSKESWDKFTSFIQAHPRGKFLSDGAYKHVYCVNSEARLDALSVMDVDDLRTRGIEVVANQELIISLLCSALISLRICPNMIRVYDVFQADYDAASWKMWSSSIHSISDLFQPVKALDKRMIIKKNFEKTNNKKKARYQYCQMEFCSGGDVEELVRKVTMLSTEQVKGYLWQMLYAMYTARETLGMRHYDIKLLNFFATSSASTKRQVKQQEQEEDLIIGFGRFLYRIDCSSSSSAQTNDMPTIIKLADFGTSVIGNETMGIPITMQQFTTLENTPPEFLLLGDSARQSFASDTFCLGLSFLHLLTGHEPYEVLMKEIRCPRYLKEKLREIWNPNDINDPYSVIKITIKSLEDHDPDEEEDEDHSLMMNDDSINDILCDTLYRYLVLLGGSNALEHGFCCNQLYQSNPAWKVITHSLNLLQQQQASNAPSNNNQRRRGGGNNNKKPSKANTADPWMECVNAYQTDMQHWSIQIGDDPHMQRVRARLQELGPGAEQVLESLLHFDPAQRCSMYDALHHPIFTSMRVTPEQAIGTTTVSSSTASSTRRKNQNNQKAAAAATSPKLASSSSHYLYYYHRNGTSSLDDGLLLL